MMRLIFLDTGTLGMVANPCGTLRAVQCQQWARDLLAAGVRVFDPEICDYYFGRKAQHIRLTTENTDGHGKGELIRIPFSVYFRGFRG